MGVELGDPAVGGPAGVGNARGAPQAGLDLAFQVCDPTHFLANLKAPTSGDRNARRVIPAVFQTPEPLKEQGCHITRSGVPDNSTHSPPLTSPCPVGSGSKTLID